MKKLFAIAIVFAFLLLPAIKPKAESVKEIQNIEKVVIPEGITSLDEWADANGKQSVLENVKELHLPSTLTEFEECFKDAKVLPNLQAIYVAEGNKYYQSINGCLYTVDGAELCFVPKAYEGKLTLPVGIMRVSQGALTDCSKMTAIQIPYGVTDLASFTNCDSLKKVVIPSSVEYGVGFFGCDQLEIIKYKWETPHEYLIGKVIKDCPKLRKICVPKGTKKEYQKMVKGAAKKLIKVGNYRPEIVEIKNLEKPELTLFQNPNDMSYFIYFKWNQVLYADSYKVQIKRPDRKWSTLSHYRFPEFNQANPNRYQSTKNYFSIHEMKEEEVCYVRVIAYRDSVKSISIPQKVYSVNPPEVDYETNFEEGTVTLKWEKKDVTGYKIEIVGSDGSLQAFDIKEPEKDEKVITGLKKGIAYDIHFSAYKRIGETEWSSDEVVFQRIIERDIEKLNVEKLIIPEGITCFDDFAYIYIGMYAEDMVLENVRELHLPSTLTEFWGLWKVRETFPNLQVIHIAEGNETLSYQDGILYENQDGVKNDILWALPNVVSGDVVMPSTVQGVHFEAFEGCDNITSLTFSKEFEYIVKFDGEELVHQLVSKRNLGICKNIKEYYVENGNKKYKAVDGAFYSADGAELYMVPQGYEGKLIIAKGTMRVKGGAFDDCTKMTAIRIPYGVTDLATFKNCDSLKKVVIPASVEDVNGVNGVFFRKCDNLEIAKLKWKQPFEKLNSRYKYTIARKCPNLKAIYIPKGTKKSYQSRTKGVTKKLLTVGNYKPQTRKIEKLDKPNITVEAGYKADVFYVSWEQVLHAERYEVQAKVGGKWKTLEVDRWTQMDIANPDRLYNLPLRFKAKKIGVKEGQVCYFRVIAYRGSVKSISEPQKAYWINRPVLPSTESKKGAITLRWKKKNVTGYKIQVYGSDGSEQEFIIKGAGKTRKTITGLTPGVRYSIYYTAYIKSGKQEWTSMPSAIVSVTVK